MELGVSDVAERLGVSSNRVRSLINAGELPARRVVEIYLSADEVESLVRKLHAWPADRDANLIVRVPAVRQWPFEGEVAGPVAVALDLWESGEPRSQRVAQQMWSRELAAGRFEA